MLLDTNQTNSPLNRRLRGRNEELLAFKKQEKFSTFEIGAN